MIYELSILELKIGLSYILALATFCLFFFGFLFNNRLKKIEMFMNKIWNQVDSNPKPPIHYNARCLVNKLDERTTRICKDYEEKLK